MLFPGIFGRYSMTTIPPNFDGAKFATKFNLSYDDFFVVGNELFSPIVNPDLSDCITDMVQHERVLNRKASAKPFANSIPNWANWTQADWQSHFDANLSDAQADLVTSFAAARVMIKRQNLVIQNLVKLIIAMRDEIWPDLPE